MKKVFIIISSVLFLLTAVGISVAAVITVDPLDSTQTMGSVFDLSIIGQDFSFLVEGTTYTGTYGGSLIVSWNPSVLTLTGVPTITFPGDQFFAGPSVVDNTAGSVSFSVASFFDVAETANFGIADLNFEAIGLGLTDIGIYRPDNWAINGLAADSNPTLIPGSVNVVPIPGALWLLGTGLVGLVGLNRRRRS